MIFISHKLREVLEIADRVTVLRRGKKIDTVPTEGATEAILARLMVGRDVLFRVEKDAAQPGEPLLEVDGLHVARRPRAARACAGVARGPRRRDRRRSPASTATASPSWSRPSPGLRRVDGGPRPGRRARHHRRGVRGVLAAASAHIAEDRHRRGLVLPFTLAENLALREYRRAPLSRVRAALAEADGQQAAPLLERVRRPRRRARDARQLALGRQPAEGASSRASSPRSRRSRSPRSRRAGSTSARSSSSTGACSSSATPGRGVLLVSLELEEIRSLAIASLVIYEGRIVAELTPDASDEELGVAMTGGGRRCRRDAGQGAPATRAGRRRSPSRRGCRATCAAAGSSSRSSPRCSRSSSAGSSSPSPATTRSTPTRRSSTAPA